MAHNQNLFRSNGKGMGWIPDTPDERDYGLYDEIYQIYGSLGEQPDPIELVYEILASLIPQNNNEALKKLEELDKKLRQFKFIQVRAHKVLRLGDTDKRILFLKSCLVYFYRSQIEILRNARDSGQKEGIQGYGTPSSGKLNNIAEAQKDNQESDNKKPLGSHKDNKKDEEINKVEAADKAIKGIINSIVDRIANQTGIISEPNKTLSTIDENLLKELEDYEIKLPDADEYYKVDDDDNHINDINAAPQEIQPQPRNKVFSYFKRNHKLHQQKQHYQYLKEIDTTEDPWIFDPLTFFHDSKKYWDWLNNSKFCFIVEALVRGFQSWASCKSNYTLSEIDGVVNIKTYIELRNWLFQPSLTNDEKQSEATLFTDDPIPFPASLSPKILEIIIEKFHSKTDVPNRRDFSDSEIIKNTMQLVARENFFEIEPIISTVLQILGPLGAYPKTLEAALGFSVEIFFILLEQVLLEEEKDKKEADASVYKATWREVGKIPEEINLIKIASKFKKESKEKAENIVLSIGSSVKLPEEYLLELKDDINTFIQLKKLVNSSIYVCVKRLNKLVKELEDNLPTDVVEKLKNKKPFEAKTYSLNLKIQISRFQMLTGLTKMLLSLRLSSQELKLSSEDFLDSEELNSLMPSLDATFLKEDLVGFANIFDASTVLEIDKERSQAPKADNQSTLSHGDENSFHELLFSSYFIPSGKNLLENLKEHNEKKGNNKKSQKFIYLPKMVDLSFWCSPITDQGSLQSCSAQAGAALIEYFSERYMGSSSSVSRRFLYKTARNLKKLSGDTGVSLRAVIKAMVLFGAPPEEHWSYEESTFDEEPSPFCYSFAQNYQALNYFRLDHPNVANDELLTRIKIALASGFPCMFGFTTYDSIYDEFNIERGYIPYPGKSEKISYPGEQKQNLSRPDKPIGGHAVVAFGYHDNKLIRQSNDYQKSSKGALLIRNSWGTDWGLNGYGWLPYDYVLKGLTSDWWSLIKSEWLESGKFGLGGTKDFGTDYTKQKGR